MLIYILFSLLQEETIKMEINKCVQKEKKKVYNSVYTTIDEVMKECYKSKIEDHEVVYNQTV